MSKRTKEKDTKKEVEWKPDENLTMVFRKSDDWKPDEKLKMKFQESVEKRKKETEQ